MSARSTVNQWSRILGVTLRPWSGHSPLALVLRGALQAALCIFLFVVFARMRTELPDQADQAYASLQKFTTLALVALVVVVMLAAAKILVGVLDLIPRRTVVGHVASLTQRSAGDILPHPLQRMIFDRNRTGDDRRRQRTELVLHTPEGTRQWTVRNHKARRALQVGQHVRLTVSPILGYVAKVETR